MFPQITPQNYDDMFADFGGDITPAVDVYEKDNNIIVEAPLPGIDPDNVQVAVENDVLSIEGSSEKKTEVDEKNYYRKEVRSGSFHRAVALPAGVDGEKAVASYKKGVLTVTVPKAAQAIKKTIKITKHE
jgi:HSP20 family protein